MREPVQAAAARLAEAYEAFWTDVDAELNPSLVRSEELLGALSACAEAWHDLEAIPVESYLLAAQLPAEAQVQTTKSFEPVRSWMRSFAPVLFEAAHDVFWPATGKDGCSCGTTTPDPVGTHTALHRIRLELLELLSGEGRSFSAASRRFLRAAEAARESFGADVPRCYAQLSDLSYRVWEALDAGCLRDEPDADLWAIRFAEELFLEDERSREP